MKSARTIVELPQRKAHSSLRRSNESRLKSAFEFAKHSALEGAFREDAPSESCYFANTFFFLVTFLFIKRRATTKQLKPQKPTEKQSNCQLFSRQAAEQKLLVAQSASCELETRTISALCIISSRRAKRTKNGASKQRKQKSKRQTQKRIKVATKQRQNQIRFLLCLARFLFELQRRKTSRF